jgi:hypothetical protein
MLDRGALRGPADDEEECQLRSNGWKPESSQRVAENRASDAREQDQRLYSDDATRWRKDRLRDVVAARELAIEFSGIGTKCGAQTIFTTSMRWRSQYHSSRTTTVQSDAQLCTTPSV